MDKGFALNIKKHFSIFLYYNSGRYKKAVDL